MHISHMPIIRALSFESFILTDITSEYFSTVYLSLVLVEPEFTHISFFANITGQIFFTMVNFDVLIEIRNFFALKSTLLTFEILKGTIFMLSLVTSKAVKIISFKVTPRLLANQRKFYYILTLIITIHHKIRL